MANTLGNDRWNLTIVYSPSNSTDFDFRQIVFFPTGEIDMNQTTIESFDFLNDLLSESFDYLRNQLGAELDPWQFFNWFFVSLYWVFLSNVGQVQPTTYPIHGTLFNTPLVDFAQPTFYPSSNNIFVNGTLFELYSLYLIDLLALTNRTLPEFLPLNESNRLQPETTTFVLGYNCQERQLKSGWILSVFAAVSTPLVTVYGILMFVVIKVESRRNSMFPLPFDLTFNSQP